MAEPFFRRLRSDLLDHDPISSDRITTRFFGLSMISAQTPLAFVARENRVPLFRIMLTQRDTRFFPKIPI
jgi:hypothetical protein